MLNGFQQVFHRNGAGSESRFSKRRYFRVQMSMIPTHNAAAFCLKVLSNYISDCYVH